MFYEEAQKEYEDICKKIEKIQEELNEMPQGKIICCWDRNHYKWYHSNDNSTERVYIPKSNRDFAEKLARKRYLNLLLKDLNNEKQAISCYLKKHPAMSQSDELMKKNKEYQQLLASYSALEIELIQWENEPYPCYEGHPENLVFQGLKNKMMRSKSEIMIESYLAEYGIPYRYECLLEFDNVSIHPDFTIRHPKTGKFFYWEHFGTIEKGGYLEMALSKIRIYISNGLIPGENFIMTFETQNYPLTPQKIKEIIELYFG